jgi:lysine 6-dehydrogenase
MRIMVLGSGLMGPAAAYNVLGDPEVTQVTLADMSETQLAQAAAKLAAIADTARLRTLCFDLNDAAAAQAAMREVDVVVAALPSRAVPAGVRAAAAAGCDWVDLSWPPDEELPEVRAAVEQAGTLAIFGCGVEPGLTEIMARYLAEKLDQVDELHIKCGGIPVEATPPLGYKIVFGGRRLPLRATDGHQVQNGVLTTATRYSGVEQVYFEGVGECEAWHENFMPWLLELDALKGLKAGTQKPVRWPGYAAKVTLLRELGLLSTTPIDVNGAAVAPKDLLDALLYPHVKLEEQDRDITTFRVDALGSKGGRPRSYRVEMVDRYDETLGFTSMARVTAFTGAIVARLVGRGEIAAKGVVTPEKVVTGERFRRLVDELAAAGVHFTLTRTKAKPLGGKAD